MSVAMFIDVKEHVPLNSSSSSPEAAPMAVMLLPKRCSGASMRASAQELLVPRTGRPERYAEHGQPISMSDWQVGAAACHQRRVLPRPCKDWAEKRDADDEARRTAVLDAAVANGEVDALA